MDKRVPNVRIRAVWMDDTLTVAEAAAMVGLSRARLWVRSRALGLPPRKEGRRPIVPEEQLRMLWLADVRSSDIAALYGCPEASVRQASRRLGLPRRPMGAHPVLSMDEFRHRLLRKSQQVGGALSEVEHAILKRIRDR